MQHLNCFVWLNFNYYEHLLDALGLRDLSTGGGGPEESTLALFVLPVAAPEEIFLSDLKTLEIESGSRKESSKL